MVRGAAGGPEGFPRALAAPVLYGGLYMELDKELLNILACPRCKGGIELSADRDGLVCEKCGLRYPIKDGIPVLLVDEAVKTGG